MVGYVKMVFLLLVFPLFGSIYTSSIGYLSDMKTSSERRQNVNSVYSTLDMCFNLNKMSTNGISLVYDREAGGLIGTTLKSTYNGISFK